MRSGIILATFVVSSVAGLSWGGPSVAPVTHRQFQAVNDAGEQMYTAAQMVSLEGIVLHNAADMLDPTPDDTITEMFTSPAVLHGPLLFDRLQAAWDGLSVIPCGAFPSLHVGISTVALLYAWKFRNFSRLYKWIWWIYIPLVISLWISTIYLRHHWVIDIFAGWAVAVIGFVLSEYVLKLWRVIRMRYKLSP